MPFWIDFFNDLKGISFRQMGILTNLSIPLENLLLLL